MNWVAFGKLKIVGVHKCVIHCQLVHYCDYLQQTIVMQDLQL